MDTQRKELAMEINLPLDKMTLAEKLQVLDRIWDDICRVKDEDPTPEWHAEVLREREKRVKEGTSKYLDFETAKKQLLDLTK